MIDRLFSVIDSINEAASRQEYLQMFDGLDSYKDAQGEMRPRVDTSIDWAISRLKKHSRIIWYLKILKVRLLKKYASTDRDKKMLERELRKFEASGVNRAWLDADTGTVSAMQYGLDHFFTDAMVKAIPEIANYEPGGKTYVQVILELEQIEKDHMSETGGVSNSKYEHHRYVSIQWVREEEDWDLKIPAGGSLSWWWCPDSYSKSLQRSMSDKDGVGHCGTCQDSDSSIWVLAETIDDESIVPHLSFEVNDGVLLQMKGYLNSKPQNRYHPAIVELLIHGDIRRVKGGTWKPETDFKFSDLSEGEQETVSKSNPDLAPLSHILHKMGVTEESVEVVNGILKSRITNRGGYGRVELIKDSKYPNGVLSVLDFESVEEFIKETRFFSMVRNDRGVDKEWAYDHIMIGSDVEGYYPNSDEVDVSGFLREVFEKKPELVGRFGRAVRDAIEENGLQDEFEIDVDDSEDVAHTIEDGWAEFGDFGSSLMQAMRHSMSDGYRSGEEAEMNRQFMKWIDGTDFALGVTLYVPEVEKAYLGTKCYLVTNINDIDNVLGSPNIIDSILEAQEGSPIESMPDRDLSRYDEDAAIESFLDYHLGEVLADLETSESLTASGKLLSVIRGM